MYSIADGLILSVAFTGKYKDKTRHESILVVADTNRVTTIKIFDLLFIRYVNLGITTLLISVYNIFLFPLIFDNIKATEYLITITVPNTVEHKTKNAIGIYPIFAQIDSVPFIILIDIEYPNINNKKPITPTIGLFFILFLSFYLNLLD